MIELEDWEFRQELLDYVKKNHKGTHRAFAIEDDNPERLAFLDKAKKSFDDRGVKYRGVVTFLSVQVPEAGEGYHRDYPHEHLPVLIHYLDPSDVPTPLHVFEDGRVVEEVVPYPGLTVYVPNQLSHGVPKHKGTRPRIQIIAMAK